MLFWRDMCLINEECVLFSFPECELKGRFILFILLYFLAELHCWNCYCRKLHYLPHWVNSLLKYDSLHPSSGYLLSLHMKNHDYGSSVTVHMTCYSIYFTKKQLVCIGFKHILAHTGQKVSIVLPL